MVLDLDEFDVVNSGLQRIAKPSVTLLLKIPTGN